MNRANMSWVFQNSYIKSKIVQMTGGQATAGFYSFQ